MHVLQSIEKELDEKKPMQQKRERHNCLKLNEDDPYFQ